MRKSLILIAVLGTFTSYTALAEETAATAEPESPWTATANIGFVSDYYFRGISQTWNKPAVQGGIDISHSSGFYVGAWGSNVSPNTYPDATVELDVYAGYNGTISAVEDLGYTVGLYGYFYPGGSWSKFNYLGVPGQTPNGGDWNTYEANFGVSYKWISAKASVTLSDWFGAEQSTGWTESTKGTTYLELNAAYPLPMGGLTLIGHVGHLNVSGELNPLFSPDGVKFPSTSVSGESNPDYTDWKIGLSKEFAIARSEGFNAGVYYVGSNNGQYWGVNGYGGGSFNGSAETRDLNRSSLVVTIGRTF